MPMGAPSDDATRRARKKAHDIFDLWWKGKAIRENQTWLNARNRAYEWMRGKMNMTEEQAHIAHFNKSQCEQLIAFVEEVRIVNH